jgi:hypothetical protein
MALGNDAKPLRIIRRRHRRTAALHLNQHELQYVAALRSGNGLVVVLPYRQFELSLYPFVASSLSIFAFLRALRVFVVHDPDWPSTASSSR